MSPRAWACSRPSAASRPATHPQVSASDSKLQILRSSVACMLMVNTIYCTLTRPFRCSAKPELARVKMELALALRRAEWAEDAWRKAAGSSQGMPTWSMAGMVRTWTRTKTQD